AMSTQRSRRRALLASLGAAAGLGALVVVGAWLLSPLAIVFVGGQEYAAIEGRLWLFGLLGTVLALLQVLIYSVVARQGRRSVLLVWGALVALVAVGLTTRSLNGLMAVVLTIDIALFSLLLALSLFRLRSPIDESGDRDD